MDTEQKKFYVTTPIYYVTASPHLGSLYSTILADVFTRWNKLRGAKTFFLTGTDEHGQKVAQAAYQANMEPKKFVDGFIDSYKEMWNKYNIDYSYFIRTTDESHVKAVQQWIKDLQDKGDIYKSEYQGYYCTPCETFVTEKEGIKPSADLDEESSASTAPLCVSCGRQTNFVSEESYFFKLSKYQDKLLKFYEENPDFVAPSERLSEVTNFVKSGLKDLSISRTTVKWGIPFPGDEKHTTYVWADALNNYITGIGYGNPARVDEFNFWWPADMQIMGKDILRFHAIYWPAFLMASNLALPKKLLVHGWLKVNNQKMSKSFGNVIDPQTLLDAYGADTVRYYLSLMAITQDSEFSTMDLEQKINSNLVNDLGNLLNRMVALSNKRNLIEIKPNQNLSGAELALRDSFWNRLEMIILDIEEGYLYRGLNTLWKFISEVNSYFHSQEPWKIRDDKRFEEVMSATAHALYAIGILIWPVMPTKAEQLLASLGSDVLSEINTADPVDFISALSDNPWNKTFMLKQIGNLFEKIEQPSKEESASSQATSETKKIEEEKVDDIKIEDFAKVMLLVGSIETCQEIEKSDKLLKLSVNFGAYGKRQILSGIKKHFACQDLVSKQAVFVYNLSPRKMMGLESHGMLLTTQDETGKLVLLKPAHPVPDGTKLK